MLQAILDGLLQGGVLAMTAAGFSLVFGVLHIINLAHGIFVLLGAYIAVFIWKSLGIDPLLTIPVAAAVAFVLGYAYQRYLLQLVVSRVSLVSTLLVTLGTAMALRNVMSIAFSPDVQAIRPPYAMIPLRFGGMVADVMHIVAFVASLILLGILSAVLNFTPLGRSIRATAQQRLAAKICGINVEMTFALTFGIAAAFAAASGVIVGMLFPFTPSSETHWTLYAFVVVVLGGAGSPAGALIGGLVLGLVSSLTVLLIGPAFPNAVAFLVLVLMLMIRPNGLLGNAFGAAR